MLQSGLASTDFAPVPIARSPPALAPSGTETLHRTVPIGVNLRDLRARLPRTSDPQITQINTTRFVSSLFPDHRGHGFRGSVGQEIVQDPRTYIPRVALTKWSVSQLRSRMLEAIWPAGETRATSIPVPTGRDEERATTPAGQIAPALQVTAPGLGRRCCASVTELWRLCSLGAPSRPAPALVTYVAVIVKQTTEIRCCRKDASRQSSPRSRTGLSRNW